MDVSLQYYDLVLAAIAGSLLAGIGIGLATTVALTTAVPGLGLVALVIIGHALFVNGPVKDVTDLSEEVEPREVPGMAVVASMGD